MRIQAGFVAAIAVSTLALGACSSGETSTPSNSSSADSASVGGIDITGTWTARNETLRSDGDRSSSDTATYTFSDVSGGVFKYNMVLTVAGGKQISGEGLGSVAPNGSILASQFGEDVIVTGYVAGQDTIVLQKAEISEIGAEVTPTTTTYASIQTLTRQS
ncbi:MAG: hypothetical protein HQ526_09645 [Actinobacteria bacterium]|nr:hypothetical protein [Actinomycetota bacterium]